MIRHAFVALLLLCCASPALAGDWLPMSAGYLRGVFGELAEYPFWQSTAESVLFGLIEYDDAEEIQVRTELHVAAQKALVFWRAEKKKTPAQKAADVAKEIVDDFFYYHGREIDEVLEMTLDAALPLRHAIRRLRH